jgi:hypothetical protein
MSKHVPRRAVAVLGALAVLCGGAAVVRAAERMPTQPSSNYLGPPIRAVVTHPSRAHETNIPAALRSLPLPPRPHASNRMP